MSTEPEETAEENTEKKIEIERIPEPMFGGTRERLRVVTDVSIRSNQCSPPEYSGK
jgi:hypothetical protein